MKKLKIVLIVLLLNQSCVSYQQTPVSLNKAYDQGKGVIYFNTGKEELKFKNIYLKDSIYSITQKVRIRNMDGSNEKVEIITALDTKAISSIFLKDKKKSNKRTIALLVLGIPAGAGILFMIGGIIFFAGGY